MIILKLSKNQSLFSLHILFSLTLLYPYSIMDKKVIVYIFQQ